MPAAAMSTLSALREKLDAKDIEMKALNDVILKQGRLLQASRAEATDEAVRRKESLMKVHQARNDKLVGENEALRDALKREELARRASEERYQQARAELQAAAELRADLEMASPSLNRSGSVVSQRSSSIITVGAAADAALTDDTAVALSEELAAAQAELGNVREELRASEQAAAELQDEVKTLQGMMTAMEDDLTSARSEAEHLKVRLNARTPAPKDSARGGDQVDDAPQMEGGTDGHMKLPLATYKALQDQRAELGKYIEQLEARLDGFDRSRGVIARQREAAAHAATAERCAEVTHRLRATETKLASAAAALEPTLRSLKNAESSNEELRRAADSLRNELARETKLRKAAAEMALIAHTGLHAGSDALAKAGSLLPRGSADASGVHDALVTIQKSLAVAIEKAEAFAPFSTPPSPQFAAPSVVEQLHLMADRPPPSVPRAHTQARSAQDMAALDSPRRAGPSSASAPGIGGGDAEKQRAPFSRSIAKSATLSSASTPSLVLPVSPPSPALLSMEKLAAASPKPALSIQVALPPAESLHVEDAVCLSRPASVPSLVEQSVHFRELLEGPCATPQEALATSASSGFASLHHRRAKQPMVLGPMGHLIPRPTSRGAQQQQQQQQQPHSQRTQILDAHAVRPATAGTANGPMPSIIGQRPAVTLKLRR